MMPFLETFAPGEASVAPPSRMDPAVKARWVEELRSGRHRQGVTRLESSDGSKCCLGVLCNMVGLLKHKSSIGYTLFKFGEEYRFDLVPEGFEGLSDAVIRGLATMNDGTEGRPHTFAEIADFIESSQEI